MVILTVTIICYKLRMMVENVKIYDILEVNFVWCVDTAFIDWL